MGAVSRIRDVRSSRRIPLRSPLSFVTSLLARFERRVSDAAPVGIVFRRPTRWTNVTNRVFRLIGPQVRLELAPRIELTLVRPPAAGPQRAAEAGFAAPPATVEVRVGAAAPSNVDMLVIRTRARTVCERFAERLFARSIRVEPTAPGAAATAAPLQARPALPEPRFPTLAVRCFAPVEVRRLGAEGSAATAQQPATNGAHFPAPATTAAAIAAPFEVDRMTDQVLAAIDRRLIAQRERLGRP
jgi:hypothetical protein